MSRSPEVEYLFWKILSKKNILENFEQQIFIVKNGPIIFPPIKACGLVMCGVLKMGINHSMHLHMKR